MRSIVEDPLLAAPPEPQSWEEAIEFGRSRRQTRDRYQWEMGWYASHVERSFGGDNRETMKKYAGEVGVAFATIKKWWWVANTFTPEEVNLFPGLPYSMWETVTSLAREDKEAALDLLEQAYTTPDITIEQFKALVQGDSLPDVTPLRLYGRLVLHEIDPPRVPVTPKRPNPPHLFIGVFIPNDQAEHWRREIENHPLFNRHVDAHFKLPSANATATGDR